MYHLSQCRGSSNAVLHFCLWILESWISKFFYASHNKLLWAKIRNRFCRNRSVVHNGFLAKINSAKQHEYFDFLTCIFESLTVLMDFSYSIGRLDSCFMLKHLGGSFGRGRVGPRVDCLLHSLYGALEFSSRGRVGLFLWRTWTFSPVEGGLDYMYLYEALVEGESGFLNGALKHILR